MLEDDSLCEAGLRVLFSTIYILTGTMNLLNEFIEKNLLNEYSDLCWIFADDSVCGRQQKNLKKSIFFSVML